MAGVQAVQAVASDTLAPWAEVVPDRGPMTIEGLVALPDDGWQYELGVFHLSWRGERQARPNHGKMRVRQLIESKETCDACHPCPECT